MSLNCNINTGWTAPCFGAAGARELYVGNFVEGITYTTGTNSIITGFTGGTVSYYKIQQDAGDIEVLYTPQVDKNNGSIGYLHSASIRIKDTSSESRALIQTLTKARLSILVVDKRGRVWLLGKEEGMRFESGEGGLGRELTDMNGANLTFTSGESQLPQEATSLSLFNIV
jgi:hypothetical protein